MKEQKRHVSITHYDIGTYVTIWRDNEMHEYKISKPSAARLQMYISLKPVTICSHMGATHISIWFDANK